MTEKVKKGQIVGISNSSFRGFFEPYVYEFPQKYRIHLVDNEVFAIVENIVCLETDKVYNEYDLITGCGDRNSKVKVGVRLITKDLTPINDILYFDPHGIYEVRLEDKINYFQKKIDIIKSIKKLQSTREEKLKRILHDFLISE